MKKFMNAKDYHRMNRPGKIEIIPTKPYYTQKYLSMAYSPGVAEPSMEIAENEKKVFDYTIKGNLVGVISDGSAVLGLGNIGPAAAKPVMEGKALLFKTFADIDVFDLELNTQEPSDFIETVQRISPTFGAINLEDIKAPECFEIEDILQNTLDIPVMHDDQHGTAVITSAALINALDINGKKLKDIKIVINGAGAAAIASARMYTYIGVPKENIIMCDRRGVIRKNRREETKSERHFSKEEFATDENIYTLSEAVNGADMFLGLSTGRILSADMLESMANNPIVFALANPIPEIEYELAIHTREDIIFGTGRSDYPNQINNVLGFPYIFRGALDVRADMINYQMKEAAAYALAKLARSPVPEEVLKAYEIKELSYGREYILPKPLDYRLISDISCAVAKAAVESGAAQATPDGNPLNFPMTANNNHNDVPELNGIALDVPPSVPNEVWSKYKTSLQKRLKEISGICFRCKL